MVRYEQSKSETGDVLCAVSPPPTAAVNMNNKMECSYECAHSGSTCAAGFNYKHLETLCEMFANSPTNLQVQQDCEYYSVCTQSLAFMFTLRACTLWHVRCKQCVIIVINK